MTTSIFPSVPKLYRLRGPAHVARFVVTIVVDPIYRMLRRRSTTKHRQKLLKGLESKLYAASSIVMEFGVRRIQAAISRRIVTANFGRHLQVLAFAMLQAAVSHLSTQAAARLRVTPLQVVGHCSRLISAFTSATPAGRSRHIVLRTDITQDRKTAKYLAGKVEKSIARWMSLKLRRTGLHGSILPRCADSFA